MSAEGGIKSIFIYGTGALRLHLLRGGTPLQRGFVIASTVAADAAASALKNAINDPEYVEKHINSWARVIKGNNNSTLELNVENDKETLSTLNEVKEKFISPPLAGAAAAGFAGGGRVKNLRFFNFYKFLEGGGYASTIILSN